MRRVRRNHTAAFKAKMVIAALKGDQPRVESDTTGKAGGI